MILKHSLAVMLLAIGMCLSCSDRYENRDRFYTLAQQSFVDKEYGDALLHIKNALRIDPHFVSGYNLLGKIAFESKKFNNAKSNFLKAYDNDPQSVEANIGLAKSFIYLHQPKEALKYINNALKIEPDNNTIKFLQGIIDYQEKRFKDSLRILHKIPKKERTNDVLFLLGKNYIELNNPAGAIETYLSGIASTDDSTSLHFELAKTYESLKDYTNAATHYEYISSHASHSEAWKYSLVHFYMRMGDFQKAQDILTRLIRETYDIEALKLLTRLLVQENDFDDAENLIQDYEKKYSDKSDLKIHLVNFYIHTKKYSQAEKLLDKEISAVSSLKLKNIYRKLLVQVLRITQETGTIYELMQSIRKDDPDDCDALMYFAHKSLQEGDIEQSVLNLRQVIHSEVDKDRAYLALARLHTSQGDDSMARQILMECVQNTHSVPAKVVLAQLFEKNDQLDDAITLLRSLPDIFTSRPDVFTNLVRLEVKNNNISQAEQDLLRILDNKQYRQFAQLTLFRIYAMQNRFDEAHALIDNAISEDPSTISLYEHKVAIFIAQNNIAQASEFVRNNVPDPSMRYFLQGDLLLAQKNLEKAMGLFEKSLDIQESRYTVMKVLNLYTQQERFDDAIALALRYIGSHNDDSRIFFLLGYLHEQIQKYHDAVKYYRQSLQINPDYFPAANNLAYLYAEKFPTKNNLEYALHLITKESFPVSHQSLDTLGWIYAQLGNTKRSISILKSVVAQSNITPLVFYHLGVTYLRDGQVEAAKEWLGKSIQAKSDFPEKKLARELLMEISG